MDKLDAIFERQAKYLKSLAPTYIHNGFLRHASVFPWDIDDRHYQEEFRLLAWRFTEELVEAHESYRQPGYFREEISDALHFFIELCIVSGVTKAELLTGITCSTFSPEGDSLEWSFENVKKEPFALHHSGDEWHTIRALAMAMMKLRQRPWRTDFRPTERKEWVMGLYLTWQCFISLCILTNITAEVLHHAYFNKAQVNDQRREEFGA